MNNLISRCPIGYQSFRVNAILWEEFNSFRETRFASFPQKRIWKVCSSERDLWCNWDQHYGKFGLFSHFWYFSHHLLLVENPAEVFTIIVVIRQHVNTTFDIQMAGDVLRHQVNAIVPVNITFIIITLFMIPCSPGCLEGNNEYS